MDEPLRIIADREGVFLYGEALDAGFKDKQIQRMRRSGEWHRVRHGSYCFGDEWAQKSALERHLLRAHAVRRMTSDEVAFSHVTSLVAQGIAVWDVDLDVVHVTRLDDGPARRQGDVRHHVGACPEEALTTAAGLQVTAPARALMETGTLAHTESALVSVNDALWQGAVQASELWELHQTQCHRWPGSQRQQIVLRLMNDKCQSVAETRTYYMFWRHGIPEPEQQFPVYDGDRLVGVTDFAWPEYGLIVEFDGRRKYFRDQRPGELPEDVIMREKRREDEIRRLTGWTFIRITWADLYHPERICARIRELIRLAA